MKTQYITPRIAIVPLPQQSLIPAALQAAELRHKQYCHWFNLTAYKFGEEKSSDFKWRGNPFSVTQTIKIITRMDSYLKINLANTVLIIVGDRDAILYAQIICQIYLIFCQVGLQKQGDGGIGRKIGELVGKMTTRQPYFIQEMRKIYQNIRVEAPPVKILESLELYPSHLFIPIVQIYTEGRYNQFQQVYNHRIEQQLGQYYVQLERPLQTGIGLRYYDEKPETKYFKEPVIVYGDVKIKIYSYRFLKRVHQFTIGFNTLNLEQLNREEGIVVLGDSDLYDKNVEMKEKMEVRIGYSDYCLGLKCKKMSKCSQCQTFVKKMAIRYNECQGDLQKLHRTRISQELSSLLSI